ncbi:MAG: RNA polymerase sigma factor [Kordiimonadaceae bacterium]|nr:RNA polymerase sigma factor [Kordiimonadaceae bacterium]
MYDKQKSDLIETYLVLRPELRRFLAAWFRDASIAEDVLQEMYLKLERTQLAAPVRNVSAFLYKIAENLALDWRKKGLRQHHRDTAWSETSVGTSPGVARAVGSGEPVEPAAEAPDPDAAFDAKRKLDSLVAKIAQLPENLKAPLILCTLEDMSHKQAAEVLGISPKAVETRIYRARHSLSANLNLGN